MSDFIRNLQQSTKDALSNSKIIKLDDFFDFGKNDPINRLAYTNEDANYKIKVIKKMQELGMTISMDDIGNICGEIKPNKNDEKTFLAIGSHTDSVPNGGQYDGTSGVISALTTVETLQNEGVLTENTKVIIYACEESSRFDIACIGSKFLADELKEEDFNKEDVDKITLKSAVTEYIDYMYKNCDNIKRVPKVIEIGEVVNHVESHIEQYHTLYKSKKQLGIVTSIGSAFRIHVNVNGKARSYWIYSNE
jgi:N-carbamoyl-L-amino-acid hydrolase